MDVTYAVGAGGSAVGEVVALSEPLSFWGGFDPQSGLVIDVRHPQNGIKLASKVVTMPSGRGSSSASTVLAEAMRLGTAPAAFVLRELDPILIVGSMVGTLLYDVSCPIIIGPELSKSVRYVAIDDGKITTEVEGLQRRYRES